MLTVDGLHTRESNGGHALILNNPEPYDMKKGGNPKYRGLTQSELELELIPPCYEITVGSDRTFFEFQKEVTQEELDRFSKIFKSLFSIGL